MVKDVIIIGAGLTDCRRRGMTKRIVCRHPGKATAPGDTNLSHGTSCLNHPNTGFWSITGGDGTYAHCTLRN